MKDIPLFELVFGGGLMVYNAMTADDWPKAARVLTVAAGAILLAHLIEKYRGQ